MAKETKALSATGDDKHRIEHLPPRKNVPGWGRGNKYVLAPEDQPKVISALRRGASERSIAHSLGINYHTWMRVKKEDEEIASVLSETRRMEEDRLVTSLIDIASDREHMRQLDAIQFALRTRHRYRDHGAADAASGDNRVAIQINLPGPAASLEDYRHMIAVEAKLLDYDPENAPLA